MQLRKRFGVPKALFSWIMLCKIFLLSGLFGVAVIGIMLPRFPDQNEESALSAKRQNAKLPKPQRTKSPLILKMFRFSTVGDYGLDNVIEADYLEVRPRRFMGFNAKSINEAVLENARLAFYTYENMEPYIDLFEFESAIPFAGSSDEARRGRELGRVTRLIADKITIEIFQDEQKIIVLVAAAGLIEKMGEDAKFINATLRDVRSNRIVKARQIIWDEKQSVFLIPGVYSDTTPSGSATGKSVKIDIDFSITPYK